MKALPFIYLLTEKMRTAPHGRIQFKHIYVLQEMDQLEGVIWKQLMKTEVDW